MGTPKRETPAGQGGGDEAKRLGLPNKHSKGGGVGIIRAPRMGQFEIIPHGLLRDARLSYRARGVAVRLLSNADGYRMTAEDLAREGAEGREAVRTALRELEHTGYLSRIKRQNELGHWVTETFIGDTCLDGAAELTEDGFLGVGKPVAGQPTTGHPVAGSSGTKSTINRNSTNSFTNTSTTQHIPSRAKAGAVRKEKSERPQQHHRLFVFGDRDRGQIDELVREYGIARVEEAATVVRRLDQHGRPVAFVSEARRWLQNRQSSSRPAENGSPRSPDGPMRSFSEIVEQTGYG